MKYERIIIASIVCVTAIACCRIVSQQSRWQYIQLDKGLVIFDKHEGVSFRAVVDGKDRARYVREYREP